MDELLDLKQIMDQVLSIQKDKGYALTTLNCHRSVYNGLLRFMQSNNYVTLNEKIGLEYVRNRTGTSMEGFYGRGDRKTNVFMKPVQNLLVYMKTGNISYYVRSRISDFQCPEGFNQEY